MIIKPPFSKDAFLKKVVRPMRNPFSGLIKGQLVGPPSLRHRENSTEVHAAALTGRPLGTCPSALLVRFARSAALPFSDKQCFHKSACLCGKHLPCQTDKFCRIHRSFSNACPLQVSSKHELNTRTFFALQLHGCVTGMNLYLELPIFVHEPVSSHV